MVEFRENEHGTILVVMGDVHVGDIIKLKSPSQPDPQGRMFMGPFAFESNIPLGWPAIRDITLKIEQLNTHWNYTFKKD